MAEFRMKFSQACAACSETIRKNHMATYDRDNKVVHLACARKKGDREPVSR